ncbi:MAG: flagellar hook-basal body complex protein FliE [Burkholderiaceae bacterium]|uniref:flagellar hook-basal body complex protein FliE n=1 Tax=Castellaniella sp. TaxID=1955812 RepID=UPI00355E90C1
MDIQAVNQVEQMLAHMRSAMRAAQGAATDPVTTLASGAMGEAQGGFAAALAQSLDKVSKAENSAYAQARAFDLGVPDVHLSDVMIDLQKANLAFQATLQTRNRLVEAYKEIANLAI